MKGGGVWGWEWAGCEEGGKVKECDFRHDGSDEGGWEGSNGVVDGTCVLLGGGGGRGGEESTVGLRPAENADVDKGACLVLAPLSFPVIVEETHPTHGNKGVPRGRRHHPNHPLGVLVR